jgi:hypothetical protein
MAKKNKVQKQFLEELTKVPIVQVACEKVGVSRNSIYRWRKEDIDFAKKMDESIDLGVDFVNDMSESQLLTLIKEKSWQAISFWLRKRSPKFKDRVEVTGHIDSPQNELTPEQQAVVTEALSLASLSIKESNQENNNHE